MKTTKKDWIYRVILLILLAIIWDIGAALTSPIFVPQKGAVFRESFLLIQNGTMLKAFRYSLVRITVAAALSAGISIPLGCLMKICHPLQKLLYPAIRAMRLLSTVDYVVWNRRENEDCFLICSQLCVYASKRSDCYG